MYIEINTTVIRKREAEELVVRVLVSGGGTGGHIYPALALIREIKKLNPEARFLYIGTENGLESTIVPKAGIPFQSIVISGFKRKISLDNVKTVMRFLKGVQDSKRYIRRFNPDIVIGTGGYVCGPVVYAAAKLGIPTIVHEQNSVPGVTNKFLSRYVDKVAVCFEAAAEALLEKTKDVFFRLWDHELLILADAESLPEQEGAVALPGLPLPARFSWEDGQLTLRFALGGEEA